MEITNETPISFLTVKQLKEILSTIAQPTPFANHNIKRKFPLDETKIIH
jgi:hypothetical protein